MVAPYVQPQSSLTPAAPLPPPLPQTQQLPLQQTCLLLTIIPLDIRTRIYELAFQRTPGSINLLLVRLPSKALLRSCHQINEEAHGVYRSAYQKFWAEADFSLHYTGMSVPQYPVGFSALDLSNVRHLTFFVPLGTITDMLGDAPPGRYNEDDMMSYRRLANTSWACTSEYEEPPQHGNDVRLTTRRGPTYRIGMFVADTDALTEIEAGGDFFPITKEDIRVLTGLTLRTKEQWEAMRE
ncbi:hypothetical protein LTR56_010714 [Elasticomyces elasticus]|nr:hypothetical protein LTR56_010714 [Elasticomyces elasticus]KAK3655352.1 hypothetical protein LTR22_010237 [Elasticomyces elasticus]KAK4922086.1 hypothetical protein LTR49_010497 [Elasticomyces elasticus]KAK5750979.1 hypothetical protein LTS12_018969 [Elasticomyces elasticus]